MLPTSDKYRWRMESKELCDLGSSNTELYGSTRAWEATLRNHFKDAEERLPTSYAKAQQEDSIDEEEEDEYKHASPS